MANRKGLTLLIALLLWGIAPGSALAKTELVPPAVAVLYFDYTGKDEQLSVLKKGLAQMLITDIQSRADNCTIVERDRLEDILKEIELGQSGKVDPKTAAKVGKLLGARYIVLGSFFDMFGTFRVDSRIIEVETGAILGSVGKSGKADDFMMLEQQLADGLGALLKEKAKGIEVDTSKRKKRKPARKKRRKKSAKAKPVKVKTATIVEYSKALEAKDRGDTEAAVKQLKSVLKAQPDFELATMDLNSLVQ